MQTNKLMTVHAIKRALLERLATEKVGKSKLKGFMWNDEPYYVKNGRISKRPTCRFKEVDTAFLQELYYTHNPNNITLLENVIREEVLPRILNEYPYNTYPDPMTLINIELGILDGEPLKYLNNDTSHIRSQLKLHHGELLETVSKWDIDDVYNMTYTAISDSVIEVKASNMSLTYDTHENVMKFNWLNELEYNLRPLRYMFSVKEDDGETVLSKAQDVYRFLLTLHNQDSLLNRARNYEKAPTREHYMVYNGLVYVTDSKVSDLLDRSGMEITESILEKITKPGVSLTISKDNPVGIITMLNALMK